MLTVLLVALAGIGFCYCFLPAYRPVNYDLRLTLEAASAKPVIAALQRYRGQHPTFPVFASQLAPYLPPKSRLQDGSRYNLIRGWYYSKSFNGKGYYLGRSLGWDPTLSYVFDGSKGRWVYNPGDGTPEIPIILHP